MSSSQVSYVVIGRNEEQHLLECLRSVAAQDWPGPKEIFYVDSASTDRSVEIARSVPGVKVLVLEDDAPSAAKARNLGWRHASGEYVQFVDGDSVLVPYWSSHAVSAFQDPLVAAVYGWFQEMHPERSVYNRLADLDWPRDSGPTQAFGGIVMVRRTCLERTGGFDTAIKTGEEPALAIRFRELGYTVLQIPVMMALHDIDTQHFAEYWARAVATGWGYAERALRLKEAGSGWLERRGTKTLVYSGALLFVLLAGLLVSMKIWLLAMLVCVVDLLRIASHERARAGTFWTALIYAAHVRFVIVPMTLGWWQWARDRKPRPRQQVAAQP